MYRSVCLCVSVYGDVFLCCYGPCVRCVVVGSMCMRFFGVVAKWG